MPSVVSARNLVKRYDELVAVDGINFDIAKGEVFGFLGPNGAGKTTTMRMIECVSPVTSGKLEVLGMDVNEAPKQIKARIGVAPQEENLDPDFSVIRNLLVYARYFGIPRDEAARRAQDLIKFMQLEDKEDVQITDLSGGMKRRLIVARALINNPDLLILDEPTTGLDPQARHLIWERVRELKRRGVTIILTTHYMDEAEQLCDRLAIMEQGKFMVEGTPKKLILDNVGSCVMEVMDPDNQGIETFFEEHGVQFERAGDRVYVYSESCQLLLKDFQARYPGIYSTARPATLEDVFLRLTGRRLRE